jgi:hypothetical protein
MGPPTPNWLTAYHPGMGHVPPSEHGKVRARSLYTYDKPYYQLGAEDEGSWGKAWDDIGI